MSGLQAGAAVSVVAHVIAVVLVAGQATTSIPPSTVARPSFPAPASIEVVLDVDVLPTTSARSSTAAPPRITRSALPVATSALADPIRRDEEVANRIAEPAPTLVVRGVPVLPSAAVIERIAARTAPSPTVATDTLPTHSTFRMRVDRDGRAHLADRRNLHFSVGISAAEVEEGRAVEWLERHHERSIAVDAKLPSVGAVVARFDVSDWAMRASGQDPYAREKLRVLDATRDARAQIRARRTEEQVIETPALVRATLDDIVKLAPGPRSAALRELWNDCDDSAAGRAARATIVRYVHTHAAFTATDRAAITER